MRAAVLECTKQEVRAVASGCTIEAVRAIRNECTKRTVRARSLEVYHDEGVSHIRGVYQHKRASQPRREVP